MAQRMTPDATNLFARMIKSHQDIVDVENKFELAEAERIYWQQLHPHASQHQVINDRARKSEQHYLDQLYKNFYQLFIDMPMVMQGEKWRHYDERPW